MQVWLLNNGDRCVPESDCECLDTVTMKLHKPRETWERNCETCTCFNNRMFCSRVICPLVDCPAPHHKLVKKEGSCCPVCVKVKVECSKDQLTCDDGSCISRDWLCDGEKDCVNGVDEKNCTQFKQPCDDDLSKQLLQVSSITQC